MKIKADRSFDGIAAKFQRNIYSSTKGKLRQSVLLRDLAELDILRQPTRILDVGAGQGQLSLSLAAQGHSIHLTDISGEMLQLAQQQAQQHFDYWRSRRDVCLVHKLICAHLFTFTFFVIYLQNPTTSRTQVR